MRRKGIVAARYAREQIGAARALVLYADDTSSPRRDASHKVSARHSRRLGEIVATETYDRGALDFYEELGAVRDETPDMVYMPGCCACEHVGLLGQELWLVGPGRG